MTMLSLSQLKDALTVLGVSTSTGDLRGEARRDELVKRLHHARMASGEMGDLTKSGGDEDLGEARKGLEKLSLSELRSALELRKISTQTPGLKGEARRHALVQRLMNTYSSKQKQNGWTNDDVSGDLISSRAGSIDEDEVDDTKSEASSSVYSTATEFIFYDGVNSKESVVPDLQRKTKDLMTHLSFTKLKKEGDEPHPEGVVDLRSEESRKREEMQRELFELRTKLHTGRQEQQQLVERSLQDAGIVTSLGDISARLQVLERERRRLQDNYFGHELVMSDVLSSSDGNQIPLEFVQEDALVLIEKRQAALKQLAERTKEAMAVAKFHAAEMELGITKSARQEEENLLRQIRQVENSLSFTSAQSSSSLSRKGHSELRAATSFHIQRDRVPITIPEATGASSTAARVPTQAGKLGMKARFMEKAKRDQKEVIRVYQKALELDGCHAENLGNYALFLCTGCEQFDQANDYFQRAINADPTHAKTLANYANFLMRQREQYAESEVYYKRALDVAGKDVNIMGGYADLLTTRAHGNRENLLQARRVLKEALTLSPLHAKNQLRMALVLADLKETELADRCFLQLLDSVMAQQNIGNESIPYSHSRKANETLASIYEKYAHFLHQCKHWERAKRMYDEALALDTQRPSLLRNFSFFLRESKPFLSPRIEPIPFRS